MKAISGIFGGAKAPTYSKQEIIREVQPASTPLMPDVDDDAARRARQRSAANQAARSGRQSTILSQDNDSLGGSE